MTDLTLNIKGDSSGAQAALKDAGGSAAELGEAVGKSAEKWHLLAEAAQEVVKKVIEFGVESVKAYAETERVQAQLARASGQYSEALKEQAKALSAIYAVDDDVIMKGQTLLAQWGGAGAATQEVTKATLNLAAAMGTDLNGATEMLIRNVESGGISLGKMGVHFTATGEKGHDLAAAVAAINAKFGGAAGANANTLTGQMAGLHIAFEDLMKDIGGAISKMGTQLGVVGSLTEAIRGLRTAAFGNEENAKNEAYLAMQTKLTGALEHRKDVEHAISQAMKSGNDKEAAKMVQRLADLDTEIASLKKVRDLKNEEIGSGLPEVTGETNKGGKAEAKAAAAAAAAEAKAAAKERADAIKEAAKEEREINRGMHQADVADQKEFDKENLKGQEEAAKESVEAEKERLKEMKAAKDLAVKQEAERDKAAYRMQKEANDSNAQALKHQVQQWEDAGNQIGSSFVNALSNQLAKLAAGGEFDVDSFMADIIGIAIGAASTILTVAFPEAAPLITGIGNLADMGVHAGFAASKAAKDKAKAKTIAKKYHSGGEIDDIDVPRYHSGGPLGSDEMHIIAQKGEHMLSRRDVANMGGHAGVEAAKGRGGSTINNYIQSLDAKNSAEGFMGSIGKGLKDALRTGQGDLPRILGARSPR